MEKLITSIKELKKTNISNQIDIRIEEFKNKGFDTSEVIFSELCYCILTANCSAESCLKTQAHIGPRFHCLDKKKLTQQLRHCHYRFPNIRASYIQQAATHKDTLKETLNKYKGHKRREWLINNIRGIGYKEASHFLRNIGYDHYAIIDKHILDLLEKHQLISKPKAMNKTTYLHIETILQKIAEETQLTLASLDLYLWYMQTRKILK